MQLGCYRVGGGIKYRMGKKLNKEKKCNHPSFERIGVLRDKIYSETEEKCTECGHIREIGEDGWKDRDAYNGTREEK